ncbi:MAG: ABC transporter ATP-binding protein, partial [Betaproteobacteria bacterium]|nr:ABC transporter ATP-binding protein [Betaproteobacteria bacterium]
MTAILQIDGVHKWFGSHQVLDGFSLNIEAGEIVGLLGPNGCGKSTVLNIVCQLLACDAGQVRMMGEPISELGHRARALIGLCAQDCALYPDLLPAENLHFFARLYGLSDRLRQQRVAELMNSFALEPFAATRVGKLSGGWRQRLHLAVSLVHRPKLLVLDEPTAAVDLLARMDLWRLIEGLRDSGTTILLTSHHLAEAERLCNRVAL